MTEKIFYANQYIDTFTATVTDCRKTKKYYEIILDCTCFYPEGGGQPADRGTLNSIDVIDVQEKDGSIVHFAERPIENGTEVHGSIDFAHRFLLMQQHSGEHIFSGVANSLYGCNNIGFHMSKDFLTVDFDRQLNYEEISEIERRSNKEIYNNIDINSIFPDAEELEKIDYRSKKQLSGQVRLIKIGNIDVCACCGLHTAKTGEIGLLKVLSHQNYKGGTRIFMSAGFQAFEDYAEKNSIVNELSAMLSSKKDKIHESVAQLLSNTDDSKKKLSAMSSKYVDLLIENHDMSIPFIYDAGLDSESMRNICTKLTEKHEMPTAIVFSDTESGEIKYVIASINDAREINKSLSSQFSCRGGGNAKLCQGSITGSDKKEILNFIETFKFN